MFTDDRFTPTQWDTARDKAAFANWFVAFVTKGFPRSQFHKARYRRLSMMWGHIAEFDVHGFYGTWCANTAQRLRFLRATQRVMPGDPTYTWVDVENVLAKWVRDQHLIESYAAKVQAETEAAERARLAELKATYEPAS